MTWHQTIVVGNLGRDPELRYTPGGDAVCSFSLAVTEKWTDRQSNERREKTTWYSVNVWGSQAETCKNFLAKGRSVMVIGTVTARPYMSNAGEPAASLDLRARDVRFLGGRSEGQGGSGYDDFAPPPDDVDDIPF